MSEDSPFVSVFKIEDKSMPKIKLESWIKKDEVRFDEPKADSEDVPFGSMDLGVDPDAPLKVVPGKTVLPDKINAEIPREDFKLVDKRTVLRFGNPKKDETLPEYVDPRVPNEKKKKIKLDKRDKEDL